jgi:probable F420-dependent oxidoreductase
MASQKPFRFAVYGSGNSRQEWQDCARKAESLGYSTLLTGDHIAWGGLSPLPALLTAAEATTILRLGIHALDNNARDPARLAHEAATVDLLSDGRLELGLGAGWLAADYDAMGASFDPPGVRVSRLEEAVPLIKRLFVEDEVTHRGQHYTVNSLSIQPKPLQRPAPPLFIGGGGKRMMRLAGQEANIIGLAPKSTPDGKLDFATSSVDAITQKVAWIREAAGARFDDLELHIQVTIVVIIDNLQHGAEMAAQQLAGASAIATNINLSAEQILDCPQILVGSAKQIVETLQERRDRYGISYITLFGDMEAFSPIVARLAGE